MDEIEIINTIRKGIGVSGHFEDGERIVFNETNLIATTDMLNEGDDFPAGTPYSAMGWISVAANLSDLAAVGAKPLFLLMSWGIPSSFGEREISEIASGMGKCASFHGVRILGGDVNRTEKLVINGTAVGFCQKPISRAGAREGDVLFLTGKVGATAAAYLIYKGKKEMAREKLGKVLAGAKEERNFLSRFCRPIIPLDLMHGLSSKGIVNAATDLSDGLSPAMHNICRESKCGALIEYEKIPFFEGVEEFAARNKATPLSLANYGNDYEILMAVGKEKAEEAKKIAKKNKVALFEIGRIKKGKIEMVRGKKISPFPKQGFSHFSP